MTVQELQRINELIAINCPYLNEGREIPMRTAQPVPLSEERSRSFQKRPGTVAQWVQISILLYRRSLDDPALFWMRDLIEKDSTPETIEWSRAFLRADRVTPPCFVRPDMSSWDSIVEVQIPGSGYGLITLLNPDLAWHTGNIYRQVSGNADPASWLYLYFNANMLRDTEFFCKQVGMDLAFRKIPEDIEKYRLVRRQFLHQIVELKGGRELLEEALRGRLTIDPAPCLLFDQKLPMTFPFHPLLAKYYSDDIRALFPPCPLLDGHLDAPLDFCGENHTPRDIMSFGQSRRDFVLKYGGTDPYLRFGGHGVERLKKMGHSKMAKKFEEVMNSGQPWILQKDRYEKNTAVFLNGDGSLHSQEHYTLWRPVYSLFPEPKMVALVVYLSPNWKVHGTSESLITTRAIP